MEQARDTQTESSLIVRTGWSRFTRLVGAGRRRQGEARCLRSAPQPRAPEPLSDEDIAQLVAAFPRISTPRPIPSHARPIRPDPGMERALASALARLRVPAING